MARPPLYTSKTIVSVSAANARSKLQSGSERRAIVDKIIDMGGSVTIGALEDYYGYDMKQKVGALVRSGWLVTKGEKK